MVQNQNYLVDVCRYIHLNPLKANLVEKLIYYPWSSHHTYLGQEQLSWVTTEYVTSVIKKIFNGAIDYSIFIENFSKEHDNKQNFYMSDEEELVITDEVILKYQLALIDQSKKLDLNAIIGIVCQTHRPDPFKIDGKRPSTILVLLGQGFLRR